MIILLCLLPFVFRGAEAASAARRPVDLHQCSLVKFDLNNLDDALYMYKSCTALATNLTITNEKSQYLSSLQNRMDAACVSLVIGSGIGMIDGNRDKRSAGDEYIDGRKMKLYSLMNYLTDGVAGDPVKNTTIPLKNSEMESRVRWGLIYAIEDRVDAVHKKLSQRQACGKRTVKRHNENSPNTSCSRPNSDNILEDGYFSKDYVIGNIGLLIIATFLISAILCIGSLVMCKICCITDFSIAALQWWTKEKPQLIEVEKPRQKFRRSRVPYK